MNDLEYVIDQNVGKYGSLDIVINQNRGIYGSLDISLDSIPIDYKNEEKIINNCIRELKKIDGKLKELSNLINEELSRRGLLELVAQEK